MSGNFHIGRIFGIDIKIDFSWLFIFFLVTWNLSVGVFPQIHPQWGVLLSWIVGTAASVLFFASVLAHEIAHSLVARAWGLRVNEIILFLFGGVSNIEKEPPSPAAEFFIAVVGPLTSITLGAIFLTLAGLNVNFRLDTGVNTLEILRQLDPLTTLLVWLGPINILLGLFNLIPGFPLDGGRVLRSVVWNITGSLSTATRVAGFSGQVVAWLFIGAGVLMIFGVSLPVLGSGLLGGIWLVLIGFFLNSLASQSYSQALIKNQLQGAKAERLMRTNVPAVSPGLLVSDLVYHQIIGSPDRAYIVKSDQQILGLVTLEDVKKVSPKDWEKVLVEDIMTPREELITVTPNEDLSSVMDKLAQKDIGQLPVLENKSLVGIISRRDVILWLQLHE